MDERLTTLEREARRGDPRALGGLVAVLERRDAPKDVERRVTEIVDAAALGPAEWIPVVVDAFGPEGLRRVRVRVFDGYGAGGKGEETDELQFDRHGATFGVRPASASAVVIDGSSDRELVYGSDLTPALLLRLLRDARRLDRDFEEQEDPAGDPFGRDDRILRECRSVGLTAEVRYDRLICGAGPLRLVLAHEAGPAGARLVNLELRWPEDAAPHELSPGDALPRRFFTGFDLQRWCARLVAEATREHASRIDLEAFFEWAVAVSSGYDATIEVEPLGRRYGARVVVVDACWTKYCDEEPDGEPHDVRRIGPVHATPCEALADLVGGVTATWHTEHIRDDDWRPARDDRDDQ